MKNDKKVGIIIVTWNKERFVLNLLNSIQKLEYKNIEIIVVDNASKDATVEMINKKYPHVHLIRNSENIGGSGGFNTGMRYALTKGGYDYLWLLDNDAAVEPETLNGLVNVMMSSGKIGVVGSLMCPPYRPDTVIEQGGRVAWRQGIWETYHTNSNRTALTEKVKQVDYVAACSMLVRPDVLEAVGLFDEQMFVHWDDVEFCLRVRSAGFDVVSTTESVIYHDSAKKTPKVFIYYDIRNGLRTMARHLKGIRQLFISWLQIRRIYKGMALAWLMKDKETQEILHFAITDFFQGKYFKCSHVFTARTNQKKYKRIKQLPQKHRYIVLPYGTASEIMDCVEQIKHLAPYSEIAVMIQKNRANPFRTIHRVDRFIEFEGFRTNIINTVYTLARPFFSRFRTGIIPTRDNLIPFYAMALIQNFEYDPTTKVFFCSQHDWRHLWKLFPAFIIGEIKAILGLFRLRSAFKKVAAVVDN